VYMQNVPIGFLHDAAQQVLFFKDQFLSKVDVLRLIRTVLNNFCNMITNLCLKIDHNIPGIPEPTVCITIPGVCGR